MFTLQVFLPVSPYSAIELCCLWAGEVVHAPWHCGTVSGWMIFFFVCVFSYLHVDCGKYLLCLLSLPRALSRAHCVPVSDLEFDRLIGEENEFSSLRSWHMKTRINSVKSSWLPRFDACRLIA